MSIVRATVTSKTTTPSNGALTAVKTCQEQKQSSSSSSAPSQKPDTPVSWEDIETVQMLPPTAAQLFALSALPASMVRGTVTKTQGKRRGKHGRDVREANITLGDGRVPWLKTLTDKTVIKIVGSLSPVNFLSSSATLPVGAGLAFLVSSLDNFSSLSAVYDQYMIHLIEVLIQPQVSETLPTNSVGDYCTAVDIDDATAPTTYVQLAAYSSAQSSRGTLSHFHRWVPEFAVSAYSGAFTSFASTKGWVDCASPNVQHYGLKGVSDASSVVQTYIAYIKYHVLFRAIH